MWGTHQPIWRTDKEPIIEHPPEIFHISDSSDNVGSDGGGSGLEDDVELNHGVMDFCWRW